MNPIIFRGKEKLNREDSDALIKSIPDRDYHFIGKWQPEETSWRCDNPKCAYHQNWMGHGICIHNKYIRKVSPCTSCHSAIIVIELNWLFENKRKYEGLCAVWPAKRQKRTSSKGDQI